MTLILIPIFSLFIFHMCLILARVLVNLMLILGTLGVRQEYSQSIAEVLTETHMDIVTQTQV